jgi:hypothetical protein
VPVQSVYRSQTRDLFQALTSPLPLIPDGTIDLYVNRARSQVASEGECVRIHTALPLASGVREYPFSSQIISPSLAVSTVVAVRSGYISDAGVQLDFRPFEWFAAYCQWSSMPGRPITMTQRKQGTLGDLLFCPVPDAVYTVNLDAVGIPIDLLDDTTVDAIPFPWSDAVPFYAAWLCMMNAQRQAAADTFFGLYEQVMMRLARMGATPSELPSNVPMDRGLAQRGG